MLESQEQMAKALVMANQPSRADRSETPARAQDDQNSGGLIQPLVRGLSILHSFSARDAWLRNKEIAAAVQLPLATTNRLIKTLTHLGYLVASPTHRKYRLAPSVLRLGYSAVANKGTRAAIRDEMQRFADRFRMFVTLGERERLDILISEVCHSKSSIVTLRIETGERVPLANSALGWALFSALPDPEKEYLMAYIKANEQSRWPSIERNIRRAVAQIEKTHYCVSRGAWREEVTTVSVPVIPHDRSSIMALGCSIPTALVKPNSIEREIGAELVSMSRRVGDLLGEEGR
jgi:DNA-binding IclR family transcriptional regulator